MQNIEELIQSVILARDAIIKQVIEEIECRSANVSDVGSIMIRSQEGIQDAKHRDDIIYRGINIGHTEIDISSGSITFIYKHTLKDIRKWAFYEKTK